MLNIYEVEDCGPHNHLINSCLTSSNTTIPIIMNTIIANNEKNTPMSRCLNVHKKDEKS